MFELLHAPKLHPNEPAQSYLSRLAAYYGLLNAREFCADFELSYAQIAVGKEREVRKFAGLVGADYEALRQATPASRDNLIFFGGERFGRKFSTRLHLHICPDCAAEDIAANPSLSPEAAVHIRSHWLVAPLMTCAPHQRPTVRVATTTDGYNAYDSSLLAENLRHLLPALLADPVRRAASDFELYGIARLEGRPANGGILDELSLGDVFIITAQFGRTLIGGSAALAEMGSTELQNCYAEGFRVLRGGREVLRESFFERLRLKHSELASPLGYTSLIGKAYFVLINDYANEKRFSPLYSMISNAMYDVLPVGADDTPFVGVPITHRRFYASTLAAKEFGFAQRTFAKLALAAGVATIVGEDHKSRRVWVDASSAETVFRSEGGYVHEKRLIDFGVSLIQRRAVMSAGLLQTVVPRRSADNAMVMPPIKRSDVDDLMARFLRHSTSTDSVPKGCANMGHFARAVQGSLSKLHQWILDGEIKVWQLSSEPRPYASILLNVEEVRNRMAPDYLFSTKEASKIIGIPNQLLVLLVDTGKADCVVETKPKTGKTRRSFTMAMCDKISADMVTAREIARGFGRSAATIVEDLAAVGVLPVAQFTTVAGRYTAYSRRQVDELGT